MDSKNGNPAHKWSPDLELENLEDDELGRGDFAKRIAKELEGWNHNQASLVMSINGDWGCGKSSFKNFIIRSMELDAKNKGINPLPVVSYNPWQWSGQDKLLQGFFDEVGQAFKKKKWGERLKLWKLSKAWKALEVITIASREVASHFQRSVSTITTLVAGGGFAFLSKYFDTFWLSVVFETLSLALIVIASLCAFFASVAQFVTAVFNRVTGSGGQSLEDARSNLKNQLLKLERPVLVVIDDLDRLTTDEILIVIQLVKANADFPNVAYLLLFQRSRVAKALQDVFKEDGYKYLQKIIQVELDMPIPHEGRLRKMLEDGLDNIRSRAKLRWDAEAKERWRNTFEDGIWPYFDTPRDVKRFLGVFAFYFEGHITDGILEVNYTDLVGLEVLRMFDHEAYEGAQYAFQNKQRIYMQLLFGDEEFQKEFELGVKKLLERAKLSPTRISGLRTLLYELFPQGVENSAINEQTWDRDNRICHPRHFPKYFYLFPDEGDVPESTLRRLIDARHSITSSKSIFLEAAEKDVLLRLFERLVSVKDELAESTIRTLLQALFDISDTLPEIHNGVEFRADAERELARVAIHLLRGIENADTRFDALKEAMENSKAITGPVICASLLDGLSNKDDGNRDQVIDSKSIQQIISKLTKRLWVFAQTDSFWNLRAVAYLIYRIKDWVPHTDLVSWLSKALKDPRHALVFVECMVNESSYSSGRYGSRRIYNIPLKTWSEMVNIEKLYHYASKANLVGVNKKTVQKLGELLLIENTDSLPREIYVISRDAEGVLIEDPSDQF